MFVFLCLGLVVTAGSAGLPCTHTVSHCVQFKFMSAQSLPADMQSCKGKVLSYLDSQASASACLNSWTISPHALYVWVLICKANCSIVWIISRCVGLYKFISHVHAVFMSHNPALLYKALNPIVLINKPCYCLAWIYNPRHCSFPNSFIAVCIVGARNPYAAVLSELSGECRNLFLCEGL